MQLDILSIQPAYMGSFAICIVIAVAVPFILTTVIGKKKLDPSDMIAAQESETENEPAEAVSAKVDLKERERSGEL